MKIQFLFVAVIVVTVANSVAGQDEYEDRYTPLIRQLKKERRRERHRVYYDSLADRGESSSDNRQSSYSNNRQSNNDFSNPDAIRKIIADAQAQSSGGSSSYNTRDREPAFNSRDRESSYNTRDRQPSYATRDRETTRRPYYYDRAITRVPVQRIEQINRGVSTILGGVGGASLDDILRGSFMFTRNENVRSVANNVLDAIFGRRNN